MPLNIKDWPIKILTPCGTICAAPARTHDQVGFSKRIHDRTGLIIAIIDPKTGEMTEEYAKIIEYDPRFPELSEFLLTEDDVNQLTQNV